MAAQQALTATVDPSSAPDSASPAFDPIAAVAQLRQIMESVPGFEPPDPRIWRANQRKSSFPDEYIESAANLVDASPGIFQAVHRDPTTLRNGVTLSNGIRAVINEALNLFDGLRFTDVKLRASLVDACDQIYAMAPGVARRDKSLTPHIEAMRHASRRKGGRPKVAKAGSSLSEDQQ
jgi:hypothetical protein